MKERICTDQIFWILGIIVVKGLYYLDISTILYDRKSEVTWQPLMPYGLWMKENLRKHCADYNF